MEARRLTNSKLETNALAVQNEILELKETLRRFENELALHKADKAQINELKSQIASQEEELSFVKNQLARKGIKLDSLTAKPASRRTMLKRMGGVAAGLAAFSIATEGFAPSTASAAGAAVVADGGTDGVGGQFSGGLGAILMQPVASNPGTGVVAGTLSTKTNPNDSNDSSIIYYRGLTNGFAALTSATLLTSPQRLFLDNIPDQAPPSGSQPVGNYYPATQSGLGTSPIPNAATAIIGSVSVINPTKSGYLTIYSGDATQAPVVATLGYTAGGFVFTTSVFVRLANIVAGKNGAGNPGIAIFNYNGQGGAVQVAFDAFGYLL